MTPSISVASFVISPFNLWFCYLSLLYFSHFNGLSILLRHRVRLLTWCLSSLYPFLCINITFYTPFFYSAILTSWLPFSKLHNGCQEEQARQGTKASLLTWVSPPLRFIHWVKIYIQWNVQILHIQFNGHTVKQIL